MLVSNAGISKIGPMTDLDADGWQAMIAFAIEQPYDVEIGDITIRPAVQD